VRVQFLGCWRSSIFSGTGSSLDRHLVKSFSPAVTLFGRLYCPRRRFSPQNAPSRHLRYLVFFTTFFRQLFTLSFRPFPFCSPPLDRPSLDGSLLLIFFSSCPAGDASISLPALPFLFCAPDPLLTSPGNSAMFPGRQCYASLLFRRRSANSRSGRQALLCFHGFGFPWMIPFFFVGPGRASALNVLSIWPERWFS